MNTTRRQSAKERAARIAAGMESVEALMQTLDAAVQQLEAARGQLDVAISELRGQSYVVKELFNALVIDFNDLRKQQAAWANA
jgi:peptidoglycan hydrolase CwlO-like protein